MKPVAPVTTTRLAGGRATSGEGPRCDGCLWHRRHRRTFQIRHSPFVRTLGRSLTQDTEHRVSFRVAEQVTQAVASDTAGGKSPHVVSLLGLSNDVLRRPWVFASLVVGCAIGSALVRLIQPRTYTSTASFVPESAIDLGERGEAGLSLPVGAGAIQPALGAVVPSSRLLSTGAVPARLASAPPVKPLDPGFYWDLLHSRALLVAVAGSRYAIETPVGVRVGTAADMYELPAGPGAARTEDAARRLDRELEVDFSIKTNVLTVRVRTFDPAFARAVVERMLTEVMATNRRMADDRAAAKIGFLARAVADARRDLVVAQDDFARFLASNRSYVPSSHVALDFHRRDAEVLESRRHFADLSLQLEQAKLARSRDLQVVSVVQRPETAAQPEPRGIARAAIAGGVGGLAVALLVLLTSGHLARLRAAGSVELQALALEWRTGRRRRAASPAPASASTAGRIDSGQER
jgi:hypothetical protein